MTCESAVLEFENVTLPDPPIVPMIWIAPVVFVDELVLEINRSSARVIVPALRLRKFDVPAVEFVLLSVAVPVPDPSWLNVIGFVIVNCHELLELLVSEIVPTVTPPATSTVVVAFVAAGWFATAPTAFGTPEPFQPGLALLLQFALAPVQLDAAAKSAGRNRTIATTAIFFTRIDTSDMELFLELATRHNQIVRQPIVQYNYLMYYVNEFISGSPSPNTFVTQLELVFAFEGAYAPSVFCRSFSYSSDIWHRSFFRANAASDQNHAREVRLL